MSLLSKTTPGNVWTPLDIERGYEPANPVDLREQYPLTTSGLDVIANSRITREYVDGSMIVRSTVFNRKANGGLVVVQPGWGISLDTPGGLRIATAAAGLNPDHTLVVFEELDSPTNGIRESVASGDFGGYSEVYVDALRDFTSEDPEVLAGNSRGGLVAAAMVANGVETPTLCLMDPVIGRPWQRTLGFAFRVGVLDNFQSRRSTAGFTDEEDVIRRAVPYAKRRDVGPVKSIRNFIEQHWLVRGMSVSVIGDYLTTAMTRQSELSVKWAHGTDNVGITSSAARVVIDDLRQRGYSSRMSYLESNTGHSGREHSARLGRLLAWALRGQ